MSSPRKRALLPLAAALFAVLGCSGATPSTPTAAPSISHTMAPTVLPASASPTAATLQPTPVPAVEPWIVYQSVTGPDTTDIRLVRLDGSDDHAIDLSELPGVDSAHPSWSADGSRILFDHYFDQPDGGDQRVEIWSINPDGSDPRRVVGCELPCLQLAYPVASPDGSLVALARYDINSDASWGPSAIEVFEPASGNRRIVAATTDGLTSYYTPRWSASGDRLVFVVETYPTERQTSRTSSTIAVAPVAGIGTDAPESITTDALFAGAPAWGPEDSILFTAADSESQFLSSAEIYQVGTDGSLPATITNLAPGGGIAIEPAWLSNVNEIAFVMSMIGQSTLAFVAPGSTAVEEAPWSFVVAPDDLRRTHFHFRPTPTDPPGVH